MENYIALLLLVVPGFIARKIYKQTTNIREDLSQFEETLYCLFYSLIIAIISLWICGAWYGDIKTIITLYNNLKFITSYAITASVLSILLGLFIKYLLYWYNKAINRLRHNKDGEIAISHTIFDDVFNDGNHHFVEVYKDGKLLGRGEIKSSVEKYKEFYLEDGEMGYRKLSFALGISQIPYKGVYIDGKTGIVIKEILTDSEKLKNLRNQK